MPAEERTGEVKVIGDESGNTDGDPDPAEKAVSQGEGGARLPLLRALRQDLPRRHLTPCLYAGSRQRGRARGGRGDLCGDRNVGPRGVACGLA